MFKVPPGRKSSLLEHDRSIMTATEKIVLSLAGGVQMGVDRIAYLYPTPRQLDGNYIVRCTSNGADCTLVIEPHVYHRLREEERQRRDEE